MSVGRDQGKPPPTLVVIPAQAGIHGWAVQVLGMDSRLRGNDSQPHFAGGEILFKMGSDVGCHSRAVGNPWLGCAGAGDGFPPSRE
jgi:hypothetical protein